MISACSQGLICTPGESGRHAVDKKTGSAIPYRNTESLPLQNASKHSITNMLLIEKISKHFMINIIFIKMGLRGFIVVLTAPVLAAANPKRLNLILVCIDMT